MDDYVGIETIADDYLTHHGVVGMRWGVRKQPLIRSIGETVGTGRKILSQNMKRRRVRKQQRLLEKTQRLEKKARQQVAISELKSRQARARAAMKMAKRSESIKNYYHPKEVNGGNDNNSPYKQMLKNARNAVIQDQLSTVFRSAAKMAWSAAADNENLSEGTRKFAEFMGGVKEKHKNAEDILAKTGSYDRLSDEEITRLRNRRMAIEHMRKQEQRG